MEVICVDRKNGIVRQKSNGEGGGAASVEREKKEQIERQRASKFSEEQIIAILKEAQVGTAEAVCAKHGISEKILETWKKRYGHSG
jgi:hypothetical protein